ncbi:hypothetical protein JST97_17500 [bacterium]|nr:hypothetical protein [bacterium]
MISWFFSGQGYQPASMAPSQGRHTRLQSHIQGGRATPGGQVQDNQSEGSAVQ